MRVRVVVVDDHITVLIFFKNLSIGRELANECVAAGAQHHVPTHVKVTQSGRLR